MPLDSTTIAHLGEQLDEAESSVSAVAQMTSAHPDMDTDDGYAVQYALRSRKEARHLRVAGFKVGLTSHAKMAQTGLHAPIYGFITADAACADGDAIRVADLIHPRVEAEIAFALKAPLRGPGCHVGAVLAATDFVMPALEVIDSRYRDFRFDAPSVIADNASFARYVLGSRARAAADLDLRTLGMVLEKNGGVIGTGAGAAVLGHPAAAVAWLVNILAAREEEIPAGAIVLTGGITEATPVFIGDSIRARFQDLGPVTVTFH